MVLLEQQQRLVEAIDAQRTSIQRAEREWRPNTPAGRAMPFEHWTKLGSDLTRHSRGWLQVCPAASPATRTRMHSPLSVLSTNFPHAVTVFLVALPKTLMLAQMRSFLRRSQRRQWRRDEAEAIRSVISCASRRSARVLHFGMKRRLKDARA